LRARDAAGGSDPSRLAASRKADIAAAFQAAVVDVLVAKSLRALDVTGMSSLVVAGGVGANRMLRARLAAAVAARNASAWFPEPRYCTDNGAMIAMAGALRLADARRDYGFSVEPRWELRTVEAAGARR
jgi:N6-L-threonylcarbamoyladenine synthase